MLFIAISYFFISSSFWPLQSSMVTEETITCWFLSGEPRNIPLVVAFTQYCILWWVDIPVFIFERIFFLVFYEFLANKIYFKCKKKKYFFNEILMYLLANVFTQYYILWWVNELVLIFAFFFFFFFLFVCVFYEIIDN